jgi:hypothetical protein
VDRLRGVVDAEVAENARLLSVCYRIDKRVLELEEIVEAVYDMPGGEDFVSLALENADE